MAETRRLRDVSGSNALSDFRSEDEPSVPTVEDKPQARVPGGQPGPSAGPAGPAVPTSPARPTSPAAPAAPPSRTPRARIISPAPILKHASPKQWWIVGGAFAVIAVSSLLLVPGVRSRLGPAQPPPVRPGQVTLDTVPKGVRVLIDGQERGTTPLTLPLSPGHHEVVLRNGAEERTLPLEVTAGSELIQRLEFAATPAATAKLSVTTEPAGARVIIDGETRGFSPVTVDDLSAGRHRIVVTAGGASSERTVTTEAGATASVVFSLLPRATGLDAGWLTITSPFEVKVMERDELIGVSTSSKIMIPAGSHEVDLVNEGLGYQSHRRIDIDSGKTAVIRIDARAPLNVNARPWAEVFIDGTSVGVTPIANHILPLGNHQVMFRHPQLGEQHQDIAITMQGPNRISVDMEK